MFGVGEEPEKSKIQEMLFSHFWKILYQGLMFNDIQSIY